MKKIIYLFLILVFSLLSCSKEAPQKNRKTVEKQPVPVKTEAKEAVKAPEKKEETPAEPKKEKTEDEKLKEANESVADSFRLFD